jgi:hypothetical protein
MRVAILEFLDTDIFDVSTENCVSFLDPLIECWDVDLTTFAVEIILNRRVAPGGPKKFEFVEIGPELDFDQEPGFTRFLRDASLSGTATPEEIEFLKRLKFKGKRPTALYYYRELQSIRDPLHFQTRARLNSREQRKDKPLRPFSSGHRPQRSHRLHRAKS